MRYLRLLFIGLAIGLASTPAQGAIIGLIGGDIDPQSIFDPLEQAVDPGCHFTELYDFCAEYELPTPSEGTFALHSIDFRLKKPTGLFYTTDSIVDCEDEDEDLLCVDTGASDLDFLIESPLFADGVTFRLVDDTIFCPLDCAVDFFSSIALPGVSVVGVNGTANAGVTAVPEPTTLLLVGPGAAALVRRYRRRSER